VPGEGNPSARVCFMGEAPGADEDASGRPFVGRAGQLLTKMIEACTFTRDDVFILNTIKCRPPGNRNPEHAEIENCRNFLERQLEIIQPEYIVCLGLVAAKALLHTTLSIGRLRGQFHAYRDSKVLVTYHPSYLLREVEVKKAAWADLQFLLRDMGIELPKK
jgi:uracil-DNA glycosylase